MARTSPGSRAAARRAQGHLAILPDHVAVRRILGPRERQIGGAARSARRTFPPVVGYARRQRRDRNARRPILKSVGLEGYEHTLALEPVLWSASRLEIGVATRPVAAPGLSRRADAGTRQRWSPCGSPISRAMRCATITRWSLSSTTWSSCSASPTRISVIHWGQVIAEGTPVELRSNLWVRVSDLGKAA